MSNCQIYKERVKRTKAEREERAKTMTPEEIKAEDSRERKECMKPFSPADLENTFGLPVNDHSNTIRLESMSNFVGIGSLVREGADHDRM